MKIKVNKDIEKYDGGFFKGLTMRQTIHVALCVVVGTGIVWFLSSKIGMTASVYVAVPIVLPIGYNGFYSKNGMTWIETKRRKFKLAFHRHPLLYQSTENMSARDKYLNKIEKEERKKAKNEHKNSKIQTIKKGSGANLQ